MKTEKIFSLVLAEKERAEELHPNFPTNEFEALAVCHEELGEVAKAMLDAKHKGASRDDIKTEIVQTIVTLIRLLNNFKEAEYSIDKPIVSEMVQNIMDSQKQNQ